MAHEDELAVKRTRIRALLDERGLDALLLATPPSVSWITCGGDPVVDLTARQGVAAVLCTRDGETLLTSTIEEARMLEEALPCLPGQTEIFGWHEATAPEVAQRLVPGGRLGIDLALAPLTDCADAVRDVRLTLTSDEQERYRALGRAAGEAIEETAGTIEPGMTEFEIAGALAAETYDRGATPIVVLVGVDERIARYRHPMPTGKALERHALLVICARRYGLTASATRIVHFGPVPEGLVRRHEACARVDAAFLAATRPGSTAGAVFAAGMAAYAAAGYPGEWRLHHQGGAAGYASREWIAVPDSPERIESGMAFAWNPSITGTKTEDTILLGPVPGPDRDAGSGPSGLEIITATGGWPTVTAAANGATFERPAILVR